MCFQNKLRNGRAPWARGGLLEKYKFYLAFENSIHCNDYISEKFWRNSLGTGAVPVVFGPWKQDVIDIAPKGSFIHTDDFKTPGDLVRYLDYLDKNDTAYLEYHFWRSSSPNFSNVFGGDKTAQMTCDLCKNIKGIFGK